jgi:Polysaccharide lyase
MRALLQIACCCVVMMSAVCANAEDLDRYRPPSGLDGFNGFEATATHPNYGWQLISGPGPVRAGNYSQRFEVRPGDCGSDNTWDDCSTDRERMQAAGIRRWQMGDEIWISFSVYLPRDFKDISPTRTHLAAIGQNGGPVSTAGGFPSHPPVCHLSIWDNEFKLVYYDLTGMPGAYNEVDREINLMPLAEMRGKWIDVIVHAKFAKDDGVLQVYVNGKLKANLVNNLLHFNAKSFNFVYGIYRPFISRYVKEFGSAPPKQFVYFDEIRVGDSRSDIDPKMNHDLAPID